MKIAASVVWMVSIPLSWLLGTEALGQIDQLIRHVPETANALVMVDADAMFASAVAKREGWQANREKQFAAGLSSIPPKARKLVLAAYVDADFMRPTWEVGIAQMNSAISLPDFAKQFGAALDPVDSVPAVRLPDDSFVVQLGADVLGAMSPGNRQQVSLWVDRTNRTLSPYLQEGIRYEDTSAQVVMILDLHNAFAVENVQLGLGKFESLQNSKIDKAELAKLIAGIKGVMLGIAFNEAAFGKLRFDFGEDASMLDELAKPLMLEIIGAYGVKIDEIDSWAAEVKGNQVSLAGPLSYYGLTRLGCLMELPTNALHAELSAPTAAPGVKPTALEVTKKYFDSVQLLLTNLKGHKSDVKTMGQVAQWFESYGRKVDNLPTLNVDKEMLQYGSYISGQLHGVSQALKGNTIQRRVAQEGAANSTKIYGGALGDVSGFGDSNSANQFGGAAYGSYSRVRTTNAAYNLARRGGMSGAFHSELRQEQQADTAVQTQSIAQGAASVQQTIQNIETATTQVRQSMTDKYQVQF